MRRLQAAALAAFLLLLTGCAAKKPVSNQPPKRPVTFSQKLPDCHAPLESYETPGFNCQPKPEDDLRLLPTSAPPKTQHRADIRFLLLTVANGVALAADVKTTRAALDRGCVETALALGEHPSLRAQVSLAGAEFAALSGGAWFCNRVTSRHPVCSFFQGASTAVHGLAAWHNAGVRC